MKHFNLLTFSLIWASVRENPTLLYVNNKTADQLAGPCSLISTFNILFDKSGQTCYMKKSIFEVAQQAAVSLTWSESPKTGFLTSMPL